MSDIEKYAAQLMESYKSREGFVVPKGVVHLTRAPDRAVIVMVETASIVPTGDA